jgi:hypothetical protein
MIPITYFPVATQHQFARNRELIRGKPYEHYFNGDLWLHDDVLAALREPMDPADAIQPTPEGLNSLLDPGYNAVENGYCELPDGTGYIASRIPFPGCTGEMLHWWYWWCSVEPARFTLWYTYNHIAAEPADRSVLTRPGLTDEQRHIGSTQYVDQYVGPKRARVTLRYLAPAELGFDTSRFAEAGIVGHSCSRARLRWPPIEAVTLVHLARRTDDGFELRSRYWIGHDIRLRAFGRSVPLDGVVASLGIKRRLGGERAAYEQLHHHLIEFTHLSTFLAAIQKEFGAANGRRTRGPAPARTLS